MRRRLVVASVIAVGFSTAFALLSSGCNPGGPCLRKSDCRATATADAGDVDAAVDAPVDAPSDAPGTAVDAAPGDAPHDGGM